MGVFDQLIDRDAINIDAINTDLLGNDEDELALTIHLLDEMEKDK